MKILEAIKILIQKSDLSFDLSKSVMNEIMEERVTPSQFGSFVTALKLKGETPEEIAGIRNVGWSIETDLATWRTKLCSVNNSTNWPQRGSVKKVLPTPLAKQISKKVGNATEKITSKAIDIWNYFKK